MSKKVSHNLGACLAACGIVASILYFVTKSPAPCGVFLLIVPVGVITASAIERNVRK